MLQNSKQSVQTPEALNLKCFHSPRPLSHCVVGLILIYIYILVISLLPLWIPGSLAPWIPGHLPACQIQGSNKYYFGSQIPLLINPGVVSIWHGGGLGRRPLDIIPLNNPRMTLKISLNYPRVTLKLS